MTGNEIITLQFGALANASGATFWNTQDALFEILSQDEWKENCAFVNPGILHCLCDSQRTGAKRKPRVVIVDDALQTGGNLAVPDSPLPAVTTWGGTTQIYHTFMNHASAVAQTAESSDQRVPLDRSIGGQWSWNTITEVELNPKSMALAPRGSGLFDPAQHAEDIEERIRYFAEDCDTIQGFHVAVDESSEWGPQALGALQNVQDSFPNRPLVLLLQSPKRLSEMEQGANKMKLSVRRGLTLGQLSQCCNLVVPLTEPHSPNANNLQLSVLHALAWDCVSLSYRITGNEEQQVQRPSEPQYGRPIGMSDMRSYCELFSGSGSLLASFSACSHPTVGGPDNPTLLTRAGFFSLSPLVEPWDPETTIESLIWRGPANGCSLLSATQALEALDASLAAERFRCIRHRSIFPVPLAVALPRHVQSQPDLRIFPRNRHRWFGGAKADGVPLLSRLRSTKALDAVVSDVARGFLSGVRSAWGEGELEKWGLERSECDTVADALSGLTREGGSDDAMSF